MGLTALPVATTAVIAWLFDSSHKFLSPWDTLHIYPMGVLSSLKYVLYIVRLRVYYIIKENKPI